jgi:diguanylate cyclase (GGDEF)-like protein
MRHLKEKLALSQRHGHPLTCATIDIDHFKTVNDEMGHAAGDWVLRELAQDLRRHLRESDSLFRLGGDELLVILPHETAAGAGLCLERCRSAVEGRKYAFEGRPIPLTISVGVAERAPNIQNAEDLLKAADESLYAAKRDGRNRLHVRCAG